MARPKTKSDLIQFRIPIELYGDLEQEAAKLGVSVSDRVAMLVVNRQRRRLGLEEPKEPPKVPDLVMVAKGYGVFTPNSQRPLEDR